MKKNNIFKLIMFYCNKEEIRKNGIYRYRLQIKNNSFIDVYNRIVDIFTPNRQGTDLFNIIHQYLDAIFIIKTKNNTYYCHFFMLSQKQDEIIQFNSWLKDQDIEYELYIEDSSNTEGYGRKLYINSLEQSLERPMYSYWNWISDIINSDIDLYILLDGLSWGYNKDEKNMYILRPFLFELNQMGNFYYIHFEDIELLVENKTKEILCNNKRLTIENELAKYRRIKDNKNRFEKHWNYSPNINSFIPLFLLGLFEISLRFNFNILHTEILLPITKQESFEYIFKLFDNKLVIPEIEGVIMFKPKKEIHYKIIFITNRCDKNMENKIKRGFYPHRITQILGLEEFKYNFIRDREDVDFRCGDSFRVIDIDINSLVIGLYSRNIEYWTIFTHIIGGSDAGLYSDDELGSKPYSVKNKSYWFAEEDEFFLKSPFQFLFIR